MTTYVVVAYDISDDARRARIARHLDGYGRRVQYSVFECDLEERHIRRMIEGLENLMEPGDGIRIYRLPGGKASDILVLGGAPRITFHRTTII